MTSLTPVSAEECRRIGVGRIYELDLMFGDLVQLSEGLGSSEQRLGVFLGPRESYRPGSLWPRVAFFIEGDVYERSNNEVVMIMSRVSEALG